MKTNLITIILVAITMGCYAQNIGIGTTTPGQQLDVNGDVRVRGGNLHIWGPTGEPDGSGEGAQINLAKSSHQQDGGTASSNNYAIDVFQDDFRIMDLDQTGAGNIERFRIYSSGNIGIGTGGLGWNDARLAVNGNIRLNQSGNVYFKEGADDSYIGHFSAPGFDGPRIQGPAGGTIALQASGIDVVIRNGRMGINTNNPTRGLLDVNGWYSNDVGNFTFYAGNGGLNAGGASGSADASIFCTNRVQASEFNAFSDARIKNIEGVSDGCTDLEVLMGIEVTNYSKIDKAANKGQEKKVIAQQVESVYPQAVSEISDVIPNIYKVAEIRDGRISVNNSLKSGDKVRLILQDRTELVEVLSADTDGFHVDLADEGELFVYGAEVHDFRVVDYEALSMLNISATQEQQRLIVALKAENASLRAANSSMEARLEQIEARLEINFEAKK